MHWLLSGTGLFDQGLAVFPVEREVEKKIFRRYSVAVSDEVDEYGIVTAEK